MQLDVNKLTPEARQALVDCLIIAARRGRLLRESRAHGHHVEQRSEVMDPTKRNSTTSDTSNPTAVGPQDGSV